MMLPICVVVYEQPLSIAIVTMSAKNLFIHFQVYRVRYLQQTKISIKTLKTKYKDSFSCIYGLIYA